MKRKQRKANLWVGAALQLIDETAFAVFVTRSGPNCNPSAWAMNEVVGYSTAGKKGCRALLHGYALAMAVAVAVISQSEPFTKQAPAMARKGGPWLS